ncbi:MAG: alpha/beta hydrolase [Verrucomicrobia bacterium]|nr:alpha/beta hydrolase [Verrucomicrobiota bacterium]
MMMALTLSALLSPVHGATTSGFAERWLDGLGAWDNSPGALMVSSNNGLTAVYWSGKNGPSGKGAFRSFPIGTNDAARIIATFNVPTNAVGPTNSAIVYVGLSTDSGAGTAAHTFGMGLSYGITSGTNMVFTIQNPSSVVGQSDWSVAHPASVNGSTLYYVTNNTPGTFVLNIAVDTNAVSFVICDLEHTNELRAHYSRAAIQSNLGVIQGIYVYNSDTRTNAGIGIVNVGAKLGGGTITPRDNIEGQVNFVAWSQDGTGQSFRIDYPTNYDSTKPATVVLWFHGTTGWRENGPYNNSGGARLTQQSLLSNGVLLAYPACHSDADYGSSNSVIDASNLLETLRSQTTVGSLFLLGESAGGVGALNFAAAHNAAVDGVVLLAGACSLHSMWTNLNASTAPSNFIAAAYGINAGAGDAEFISKTAGHDPVGYGTNGVPADRFNGMPMLSICSTSDTTVYKASTADALFAKLQGRAPEYTTVLHMGGHGNQSAFTNGPAIWSFIQRNAYPSPVLTRLMVATGQVSVRFKSIAGHSYRIEHTTNLVDWVPVIGATFTEPQPGLSEWVDDGSLTGGLSPARDYRVRVVP